MGNDELIETQGFQPGKPWQRWVGSLHWLCHLFGGLLPLLSQTEMALSAVVLALVPADWMGREPGEAGGLKAKPAPQASRGCPNAALRIARSSSSLSSRFW